MLTPTILSGSGSLSDSCGMTSQGGMSRKSPAQVGRSTVRTGASLVVLPCNVNPHDSFWIRIAFGFLWDDIARRDEPEIPGSGRAKHRPNRGFPRCPALQC